MSSIPVLVGQKDIFPVEKQVTFKLEENEVKKKKTNKTIRKKKQYMQTKVNL